MRYIVLVLSLVACSATASPAEREGWAVIETSHAYQDLVDRVKTATKANKMGVVTEAGPTEAAANRGVTIPGNRVIGVYNNDFAVRMLEASEAEPRLLPLRRRQPRGDDNRKGTGRSLREDRRRRGEIGSDRRQVTAKFFIQPTQLLYIPERVPRYPESDLN